jgi:hypothetical protein
MTQKRRKPFFDGSEAAVQDRNMSRLVSAAVAPRFLGFASLGLVTCVLGCGLRTDPNYTPVCVDDNGVADDDTAGTAGTDDTDTGGVPLVPRSGSCEDPIDIPAGQTVIVRGSLGGCSSVEGWCGGSGPEDVYRIGSLPGDVFVDFLPQETNFNPVLRVVRAEDACLEATLLESEVCAPIVNSVPGRGFFDDGSAATYYIIVDTELGESGDYAFEVRFGGEAFQDECVDFLEETPIELMAGGNFVWEANLEDTQGRLDSGCSAPGDEDVFSLILTGGGNLSATVEVLEGDIEPIVSLRAACATTTEVSCGATATASLGSSQNAYLVVDQLGAAKGRYRLTVDY